MTAVEKAHVATPEELAAFWSDGEDVSLGRHLVTPGCCSAEDLFDLVADAVWVDDEEPTAPVRTETACNAVRCSCVEFAEGAVIAGYRTCHVCSHSAQVHLQRTAGKKARR